MLSTRPSDALDGRIAHLQRRPGCLSVQINQEHKSNKERRKGKRKMVRRKGSEREEGFCGDQEGNQQCAVVLGQQGIQGKEMSFYLFNKKIDWGRSTTEAPDDMTRTRSCRHWPRCERQPANCTGHVETARATHPLQVPRNSAGHSYRPGAITGYWRENGWLPVSKAAAQINRFIDIKLSISRSLILPFRPEPEGP